MPWLNKINFNIKNKKIITETPNLQQHEPTTVINNQPQRRHYILCIDIIYNIIYILSSFFIAYIQCLLNTLLLVSRLWIVWA